MKTAKPNNIDQYIARFPSDVQAILQRIRATIRKAAPRADEKISYGIPAFAWHGNLIFFAAYKNHIGIYPAPRGVAEFKVALSKFDGGKGTLKIPLEKTIPFGLIGRIVKYRVKQNREKAAPKQKKR